MPKRRKNRGDRLNHMRLMIWETAGQKEFGSIIPDSELDDPVDDPKLEVVVDDPKLEVVVDDPVDDLKLEVVDDPVDDPKLEVVVDDPVDDPVDDLKLEVVVDDPVDDPVDDLKLEVVVDDPVDDPELEVVVDDPVDDPVYDPELEVVVDYPYDPELEVVVDDPYDPELEVVVDDPYDPELEVSDVPVGERTAVVTIGINYFGQVGELKGCVNDSNNYLDYVSGVLMERKVVSTQLVDTLPKDSELYPTRANIERVLIDTVHAAWKGDFANVLVHYSGHGDQVQDHSGDEADGKDETLIPVDYATAGIITDDWLFEYVINALPPEVRFFGLIDACHNATVFDLRYKYEGNPPVLKMVNSESSEISTAMMISGSEDSEYSYDVLDAHYGATGAMTSAWLRQMKIDRKRPALDILKGMQEELSIRGYPQTPQLSSSKMVAADISIYAIGEW